MWDIEKKFNIRGIGDSSQEDGPHPAEYPIYPGIRRNIRVDWPIDEEE